MTAEKIDKVVNFLEGWEPSGDARQAMAKKIVALLEAPAVTWPQFAAPPKYVDPAPGWEDPALPDFTAIWRAARPLGYAVGLHGSMRRDCDLIAAPWTDDAQPAAALIAGLCEALNARQVGEIEQKPQGRVAVSLQVDGYVKLIDLSIFPLASRNAVAVSRTCLSGVWDQAQRNHAAYSATGDKEHDLRFFTLGLVGEAGELANFVKKRWRDGVGHDVDMQLECADVLAYLMMLANALGMTPAALIDAVSYKQQVFIRKMESRGAPAPQQDSEKYNGGELADT